MRIEIRRSEYDIEECYSGFNLDDLDKREV
jgi:hypothetical protein